MLDSTVTLEYAPHNRARRRRKRVIVAVLTFLLLSSGATAYHRWILPRLPAIRGWYRLRQCLSYSPPADHMATGQAKCWLQVFPGKASGHDVTVFLHERYTPGGKRWLLAVDAFPSSFDESHNLDNDPNFKQFMQCLQFTFNLCDPDRVSRDDYRPEDDRQFESPGMWRMGQAESMKLFNGQPDPNDRSHFTIVYDLDGQRGTIDGWLRNDSTVEMKIRDGPALQWQN